MGQIGISLWHNSTIYKSMALPPAVGGEGGTTCQTHGGSGGRAHRSWPASPSPCAFSPRAPRLAGSKGCDCKRGATAKGATAGLEGEEARGHCHVSHPAGALLYRRCTRAQTPLSSLCRPPSRLPCPAHDAALPLFACQRTLAGKLLETCLISPCGRRLLPDWMTQPTAVKQGPRGRTLNLEGHTAIAGATGAARTACVSVPAAEAAAGRWAGHQEGREGVRGWEELVYDGGLVETLGL